MAQTFGAWLTQQQHREDAIGDFAKDFIGACRWRKEDPETLSDDQVRWQMLCLDACIEATRAFNRAKREWRSLA